MIAMANDKIGFNKNLPEETYSVGIYAGPSPFELKPYKSVVNPIISRNHFRNGTVKFVADPFGIYKSGIWYLFYETMGFDDSKGRLCVSTSTDLINWSESKVILEESFHLSYPQVFLFKNTFYMLPESFQSNELRLYVAVNFPLKWVLKKVLLPISCVDSTIFIQGDLIWLFVCDSPHQHDNLRLFYSEDLNDEWIEHPNSPIRENDNQNSRPAGKLFRYNDKLYRVAQDCKPFYGSSVGAYEIKVMDKMNYEEIKLDINPILKGGDESWNKISMHHADLHEINEDNWIAFVDGRRN